MKNIHDKKLTCTLRSSAGTPDPTLKRKKQRAMEKYFMQPGGTMVVFSGKENPLLGQGI